MRAAWWALWLSGALAGAAWSAGTNPPDASAVRVERFVPQGVARGVRQASARFSAPMVSLGDPRQAAPFDVACPEPGTGRWVDPRTWVYDFGHELSAGVSCSFRLRADVRAQSGAPVAEGTFAFSTGGPAIVRATPREGAEIDEDQLLVLQLDGPLDETSVPGHAHLVVDGVPETVPLDVVSGPDRDAVLATLDAWEREGTLVVLAPRLRLPNGVGAALVWDAGIRAPSGAATEQPQTVRWTTRRAFTAEFTCERENATRGCTPFRPMRVVLSAPVSWAVAREAAVVGPNDRRWSPAAPSEQDWTTELVFRPPFPAAERFRVELPAGLVDDAGRPLDNAASFPLDVRTDVEPPLAKFAARFGIIEARADPALPVTIRNLEPEAGGRQLRVGGRVARVPASDALAWLRRVAVTPRTRSVFADEVPAVAAEPIALPRPANDRTAEVIGIPLPEPGLYVVELESVRLGAALTGAPTPLYVPTAALVTNLAVHLQWGRESSLVWVTSLDTAAPVAGARVSVTDCTGTVRATGTTDVEGLARFASLPDAAALPTCAMEWPEQFFDWRQVGALRNLDGGLFVLAESRNDASMVHSSWDRGIEPFRFDLPAPSWEGPDIAHSVLDRTLFRPGETVHLKHLLRREAMAGFAAVAPDARPTVLSIRHLGSDERYDQPVDWRDDGSAESTWSIPRAAKLGRYDVVLLRPPPVGRPEWEAVEHTAGRFRVEEFRVPLMRGVVQLPAGPLVAARKAAADLGVTYLAGGVAAGLPVVLRGELRPRGFAAPDGFDAYTFANGPVRPGVFRDVDPARDGDTTRTLPRQALTLDATGTARGRLVLLPRADTPRSLVAELEFRDPNGEAQTVSATVPVLPAAWLPGLRSDRWALERGDLAARAAVVDGAGAPVAGAPIVVTVFDRRVHSTRTRVVGGFYAYQHTTEIRRIAELCRGVTDVRGRFACDGRPDVEGDVVLEAAVTDAHGRVAVAHTDIWVARGGRFWFAAEDGDRIDVLPERRRYEPGETARFQVRMPFREATALVTIGREGVGTARVLRLSGAEPVIELPVEAGWAPNTFVSVLLVRGRVGEVQPTAMVDLGRPAFRLGIAEIEVGARAHALDVTVTTDREAYRVRDTAVATVTVRDPAGAPPPPGSEVAVAVVDEGLLELSPNPSWDVLRAMLGRRGYGIQTATAQLEVVGKRHYGQKAAPPGGGGGRRSTRELFDTLLLWAPRVALDARGEARVEVPLGDALTSFRIEAIATAGLGRFGAGGTAIRTTQDLMVLSGLPPLVREGDRFRAGFTVRNTTARAMSLQVRAAVAGLPGPLPARTFALDGGASAPVEWDVAVPAAVGALDWDVAVGEPGGAADHLRVRQEVRPAVPVRTLQATLFRWAPARAPVPVRRPADALPDRGGIAVRMAPTLAAGLGGVREWMRRYPFTCLEQRLSRAVALGDEEAWLEVVRALPAHQDGDGLLAYFPTREDGSEVLTSYVLSLAHAAGRALPADARDRMLDGLGRFVDGGLRRESRMPDRPLRHLSALEALARYGRATPERLATVEVTPALWPTSALLDWWSILYRMPDAPDRAARLADASGLVRARLDLSGTALRVASSSGDALPWLMVGPSLNAVRLVLLALETGGWQDELPQLVRGALGLQQAGHWGTTTANAWGALAIDRAATAVDAGPVTGTTTAALDAQHEALDWSRTPAGGALELAWPAAPAELVLTHAGTGAPWVTVESRAALPLRAPVASGYRITKRVAPLEVARPGVWSVGDRLQVQLEIEAQSDASWIAVDDPVPAGASHLGGMPDDGATEPSFVERSFASWRGYWAYVPAGRFTATYSIRLNQAGTFELPPTRVEALYQPDLFGEFPNPPMEVQ